MRNNSILLLLILFAIPYTFAQEVENDFVKLELSQGYSNNRIDGTNEDLAKIDIFQVRKNEDIAFLTYLMSNKLNAEIEEVSMGNFRNFLTDLGSINITKATEDQMFNSINFFEANFSFEQENNKIFSLAYIYVINDILYRIIFMLPNKEYYTELKNEINSIMETVNLKKESW